VVILRKPVEFGGLKLEIKAGFQEPFYYVGFESYFSVEATNLTHQAKSVEFEVTWRFQSAYGTTENHEDVKLDVPAGEQRSHGLRYQWLYAAGEAVYIFTLPFGATSPHQPPPFTEVHPMASYTVVEKWRRDEELARVKSTADLQQEANTLQKRANTLQGRTFWAFVASVAASVVLAGVGIYLAFYR